MRTQERSLPTAIIALIAITIAIAAIVTAADLGVLSGGNVQATDVTPTPISGNTSCLAQQQGQNWTELKIDESILSNDTFSDGTLSMTISNYTGTSFDWSSNMGVDAVFVKGGNVGGFLYLYDPEATSDTGLTTPNNPNGQPANISHVSFCYDEEPTPTPTSTSTSTPTPTSTSTSTPTPTSTSTPTPTQPC